MNRILMGSFQLIKRSWNLDILILGKANDEDDDTCVS